MFKNIHLIPAIIQDIVNQLEHPNVRENERLALIQRLESIRDFVNKALNKDQKKIQENNKPKTKTLRVYK